MRKSQIFDSVPANSSMNAQVLGKKQDRSLSKNASTLSIKMDDSCTTPLGKSRGKRQFGSTTLTPDVRSPKLVMSAWNDEQASRQ